jgi:hypothetical protein
MSKTLRQLLTDRPWIEAIDDRRDEGEVIYVTLADGWVFSSHPHHLSGFATVAEAKAGTAAQCVKQSTI